MLTEDVKLIKLFAMDVDGTLTDDGVYMDGNGGEFKRFSVRDGFGIVMLMKAGIKVAFISGRYSSATQQRADNLKISACINGTKEKLNDLKSLAAGWGIQQHEIAFAGDDVPDVDCLAWSQIGFAVANASDAAKKAASYITKDRGGFGAVRECAEYILEYNKNEKI